jgi:ribosomal protein S18 acetylase RimI-like enzyme
MPPLTRPDFTVRRATRDDFEALLHLFAQVDNIHRDAVPSLFGGGIDRREMIRSALYSEELRFFVAASSEGLAGFALVAIEDRAHPMLVPDRYGHVMDIVVDSAFRRHGVGTLLLDACEGWARAEGASHLELTVFEFNEGARRFYEKHGFSTQSRKMVRPLAEDVP